MKKQGPGVLVSCGGKWVGTVLQLREAQRRNLHLSAGRMIVASSDALTPAGCFADAAVVVPPIVDPSYIDAMLLACQDHEIGVLVPLLDLDLFHLAPHLGRFGNIGTSVVCPPPELVDLCFDKYLFSQFAEASGLPHPQTRLADDLKDLRFPAFYKKRYGFGSIGSGVCASAAGAAMMGKEMADLIFQEYLPVQEFTVDAYIARSGKCIVCVPRVRDKVVAGESYKTHTVRDPAVTALAMATISALVDRGLRGPLNVQILATNPPTVLEVNTRIGSATVLSNMACHGRLFDALLQEAIGGHADGDPSDFSEQMMLSRFLGDVFYTSAGVVGIWPD